MKALISILICSVTLISCSHTTNKQNNQLATERNPAGIILSNHGSTIPENSHEILADLKIKGCDWTNNQKIIKDYNLEQIAHSLLENQHSLFGYYLLAIIEHTGICLTDSELNPKISKPNSIKIFKPYPYENKIVALNTGNAIVINKKILEKMPFSNKQLLFLHESAHSALNTFSDKYNENATEIHESSIQGLIAKIDKAMKNSKSISPEDFQTQLANGNFLNVLDEQISGAGNFRNWVSISNLIVSGYSETAYNKFASSVINKDLFSNNIEGLCQNVGCYSKLMSAFTIAQKWASGVKHIEFIKNSDDLITKISINGELIQATKPYKSVDKVTIALEKHNGPKANFYILEPNNNSENIGVLNYVEYYDYFKPITANKIFENDEIKEIQIEKFTGAFRKAFIKSNNELYIFTPNQNKDKSNLASTKFDKESNNYQFYKDMQSNSSNNADPYFYYCDSKNYCAEIGNIKNKVHTQFGRNKNFETIEDFQFIKIGEGCIALFRNYMSCSEFSNKIANCTDSAIPNASKQSGRFSFTVDQSSCKVIAGSYNSDY